MLKANEDKLKEYETILSAKGIAAVSKSQYMLYLKKFFEFIGDTPYKKVSKAHVAAFINSLDEQITKASTDWEVKRSKFNYRTKNFIIFSIAAFYSSIDEAAIAKDIKFFKTSITERHYRIPVHLSEAEVEALIKADITDNDVLNWRNRLITSFLVSTGVRVSEFCSLRFADMRLNEPIKGDKKLIQVVGKGDKQRKIIVPKWWIDAYKKYRNDTQDSSQFLFSSRKQNKLVPHTIWYIIKQKAAIAKIASTIGIEHNGRIVYPHNLRSTFISELVAQDENLLVTQELAGHTSPVTTKMYTKISDQQLMKVKTMKKLEV